MPLVRHTLKTQKRWTGKDANLRLLTERIERFFNNNGFKTRRNTLPKGYEISIASHHIRDFKAAIKVKILGVPHDFIVEFSVGTPSRFFTMLRLSTIPFGGGIFVLRGLKLQEALERLEKDFWIYVAETVTYLTGTCSEDGK